MQVHPGQISPAENYDIFYFIRNHTDSATYFVRGVVYDVRTGAVLQTVNLTQSANNARLFAKTVQAPADSSGNGRNIVAIATVYTDSGYTTKSTDYEEQEQYFLVKAVLPMVGSGGGVDYRTIREMVDEALKPILDKLEAPEPSEPDASPTDPTAPFQSIYGAIGALTREIGRIPKEQIDLSGISEQLTRLHSLVETIPEPEAVDLQPVLAALEELRSLLTDLQADVGSIQSNQTAIIDGAVSKAVSAAAKTLKEELTTVIEGQEFTFPVQRTVKKPEQSTPSPIDVSHLM